MQVEFRFYEELNDFLAPDRRKRCFVHDCPGHASIKDVIESLGVPHTEVELILVDGESVDFSYQPRAGQRIAVYPKFEGLDITPLLRVRPQPLRRPRFVLDGHLGKLARLLRLLGLDCDYRNHRDDAELARISAEEDRILLTRDRGLLKRKIVTHGYLPRSDDPRQQLDEVLQRFDLYRELRPFSRCMRCNGSVSQVPLSEVEDKVPPRVRREQTRFFLCRDCGQVYWPGSHYRKLSRLIEEVGA